MDPRPIPFSSADLERRRLESTIDQDLHSLSLTTASSSAPYDAYGDERPGKDQMSDTSFTSISTIEYPRAAVGGAYPDMSFREPRLVGPHDTPRAAGNRKVSQMSERSMMDASPVSTAGHHVSAVTLAEGVFKRAMGGREVDHAESGSEWDPERSFGRLVGELGKAMNNISPRPTSPFSPHRSPRSPSPYTTSQLNPNLSFTLNRNDPLPSPPHSRQGSRSGSGSSSASRTREVPVSKPKRVLGESNAQNIAQPAPRRHVEEKHRVKAVQQADARRPVSAPVPSRPHNSGDVTGMTGLMETPAKGAMHGSINKNGNVGDDAMSGIPASLATLHARLRALETQNSVSRRRVRELESELERAREEVEIAKTRGDGRLREVIGEKTALEDLVQSLRTHLSRLTVELEQHKTLVTELRQHQSQPVPAGSPPRSAVTKELIALRKEVERLGNEVHRLGGIVEQGLETRKKARGEETIRADAEEGDLISLEDFDRVQKDVEDRAAPSKLRQGLHRAGSPNPQLVDPSVVVPQLTTVKHQSAPAPKSHRAQRAEGPSSPFPSIREEDEPEFFEASRRTEVRSPPTASAHVHASANVHRTKRSSMWPRFQPEGDELPPQTVLTRVIRELEADFKHYKSIYSELAEQYKVLDAASVQAKRHVLAEHLKEVIDTLEQKADQIASLYELLSFNDLPEAGVRSVGVKKSVFDVVRMVRDSLGEEGLRRLEADGVFRRR